MERMTIEVLAKSIRGKEKKYVYTFKEVGNDTGYGNGQYIYIALKDGETALPILDCRYMVDYSLEKAATEWVNENYGRNLISYHIC